jgi:hypothetical protein
MSYLEELEKLVDEGLCHECHAPLTDEELSFGYLCRSCIDEWCEEAMHHQGARIADELGL